MDIPMGEVDWIDYFWFDEERKRDYAIISNLWTFQNCTIGFYKAQYVVLDPNGVRIQYDVEGGKDLRKEQCVVIGRKRKIDEYYVLVVRSTSVDSKYKRNGVGLIQSDYVIRQRANIRVV